MVVGFKNTFTACLVSLMFVSVIPIHDEDISYEVMSENISFIFNRPIICKKNNN